MSLDGARGAALRHDGVYGFIYPIVALLPVRKD